MTLLSAVQLTKELEAAKARVEDEMIATVQIATSLEGRLRQAKQEADLAQQQAQQADQRANQVPPLACQSIQVSAAKGGLDGFSDTLRAKQALQDDIFLSDIDLCSRDVEALLAHSSTNMVCQVQDQHLNMLKTVSLRARQLVMLLITCCIGNLPVSSCK